MEQRGGVRGYPEYDDLPEGSVKTYALNEVMAEKILALGDRVRNEPRDLYGHAKYLDAFALEGLRSSHFAKLSQRQRFVDQAANDRQGEFRFIAVRGWLDCEYSARDGRPFVEFSWEGFDEGDERCGRGWATVLADDSLAGRLFFHAGDNSAFTAKRASTSSASRRR